VTQFSRGNARSKSEENWVTTFSDFYRQMEKTERVENWLCQQIPSDYYYY